MNHNLAGKVYPTFQYEVGREKIFEYARATLSKNPFSTDPEFAAQSHYGNVVAPPTFAAVYCHQALRNVFDDKELAMKIPRIVHGEQTFEFGEVVMSGDTISTTVTITDIIGRKVATLISGYQISGNHNILWTGRDTNGNQVPSGVYFYNLNSGPKTITKKMTLSK